MINHTRADTHKTNLICSQCKVLSSQLGTESHEEGEQEMGRAGWGVGAEQDFGTQTAPITYPRRSSTRSHRFTNNWNSQQTPLAHFIAQSLTSEFASATVALEANVQNRDPAALAGNRQLRFLPGAFVYFMFQLQIGNKNIYILKFWAELSVMFSKL